MAKTAGQSLVRTYISLVFAVLACTVALAVPAGAVQPDADAPSASPVIAQGAFGDVAAQAVSGIVADVRAAAGKAQKDAWKAAVVDDALAVARDQSSATEYFIAVDLTRKRTVIFEWKDDDWALAKYWVCSVGAPESPTIVGSYDVDDRGESFSQDGYTCYYYTQFEGNYLLHSVKYDEGTYDIQDGRLGEAVSEGCVRLDIENAKWIYDTIPDGTAVVTYE